MELRVVRHTDRFDDACRFWGETLGWPVTRQWPASEGSGRGCIFGYGDVGRVELLDAPSAEPVAGVMLSIEHPDIDALHDHLLAAGVSIERAPADQPWGHRNLVVHDPSGIALVFFHWIADRD